MKERFRRPKKLHLIEKAVTKFLITVENIKMNDIEKILCQIGQSKELPPLLFDSGVDLGTFLSPRTAAMYTICSKPFKIAFGFLTTFFSRVLKFDRLLAS